MRVIVISDAHLYKTPDGSYWCNTAVHGYEFWRRYTTVFDTVRVVARVLPVLYNEKLIRVDGPGVEVKELPFIRGAKQYALNFFRICKALKKVIEPHDDAAIFRVPSLPAFILLHFFKKTKKPYCLEVIVDPRDCYADNWIAKVLMTYITKKECLKANGVSYVTKFFLEQRYPCKALINGENERYFTSYYSSIKLDQDFFSFPRKYNVLDTLNIIHVSSIINDEVKGHDTLIKIVKRLKEDNINVTVNFVGDGLLVPKLKKYVVESNLEDNVRFLGLFSSKNDIRDLLLNADLFVFPTKAEGLPRVLIEAMATGLPCLSTPVNGIPELLDHKYLFAPNDIEGFVLKIESLLNTPEELEEMSAINIDVAKNYLNDVLQKRRDDFYRKLLKLCNEKQ